MDEKTVLVTGIGGNVGQGILRNIIDLKYNIRLVGCDITSFNAGNHLCDKTFKVPYAYEDNYIKNINNIIKECKVDLVIPSTDYEIYYLALNRDEITAQVVASDAEISEQLLDKYLTYQLFSKHDIPFAKSWLVKDYNQSVNSIIAKPRKGRGSRGIIINPDNINNLDDTYLIQELHKGIEITTSVYINRDSKVHGICSMERKLTNGTTSQVIINDKYDSIFLGIANKIADLDGIKGSINIQSIVDENGQVFPFEINCRISGTNSIRHNIGFQDVKYTLQEYLFDEKPDLVNIKNNKAIAVRILMDVIYTDAKSFEDLNNNSVKHILF
tara:strand:- start:7644 stop:8627 length:984 start_codon:yes stop_codon:yes gene_type:complete